MATHIMNTRTKAEQLSDAYDEAIRRQVLPGGMTRYHASRDKGATPTDRTSFIAGRSDTGQPASVLYILFPPGKRAINPRLQGELQPLNDQNGNRMMERWPRRKEPWPMSDIAVLPLQISTSEEPVIIEAWRRLDPPIQAEDILMRMEGGGGHLAWNRCIDRFDNQRVQYNILDWLDNWQKRPGELSPDEIILARLSPWNIQNNTSRGFTPGLIVPELGEEGGRIPVPPRPQTEISVRMTSLGYFYFNQAPAATAVQAPVATAVQAPVANVSNGSTPCETQ